jgi:hypothetical protein
VVVIQRWVIHFSDDAVPKREPNPDGSGVGRSYPPLPPCVHLGSMPGRPKAAPFSFGFLSSSRSRSCLRSWRFRAAASAARAIFPVPGAYGFTCRRHLRLLPYHQRYLLKVELKVNEVINILIIVVNRFDMSLDGHVLVVAGRRSQSIPRFNG